MQYQVCKSVPDYFQSMFQVTEKVSVCAIDAYFDEVLRVWHDQKKVLLFGNGGSAYTASHHATDYVKFASIEGQERLRAMSLVDNIGMSTAIANDISYEQTFSFLLETFGEKGDIAVAISCSGNSPNVVEGCKYAKEQGLKVVAITGFAGGKIGEIADIHINIPDENYGIIEDIQMSIGHIIAQRLRTSVIDLAKKRGAN